MPLTRHAYPVLQLAKFWFLTYVYVVDPGAELWPDKIVGLRKNDPPNPKLAMTTTKHNRNTL